MTKTECVNKEKNLENCPCSYPNCDKKRCLLRMY